MGTRWEELKRIWHTRKKEGKRRLVAIGWRPDLTYKYAGNNEYHKYLEDGDAAAVIQSVVSIGSLTEEG